MVLPGVITALMFFLPLIGSDHLCDELPKHTRHPFLLLSGMSFQMLMQVIMNYRNYHFCFKGVFVAVILVSGLFFFELPRVFYFFCF